MFKPYLDPEILKVHHKEFSGSRAARTQHFTARAQARAQVRSPVAVRPNNRVPMNFTFSLRPDCNPDSVCISDYLLQSPHVTEKFSPQVTEVSSQTRTSACHPHSYYSKNSMRPSNLWHAAEHIYTNLKSKCCIFTVTWQ